MEGLSARFGAGSEVVAGGVSAIAMEAKRLGAEMWFWDESRLRSDYHAGITWAPKGQTLGVRGINARYRLNILSVVNRWGRTRFMIEKKGLNTEMVCRLMVGSRRFIFSIWDGHPIHKSSKVAKTVRSYKGRLRVYELLGIVRSPIQTKGCGVK